MIGFIIKSKSKWKDKLLILIVHIFPKNKPNKTSGNSKVL